MAVTLPQLQQVVVEFMRDNFPWLTPNGVAIIIQELPKPLEFPVRVNGSVAAAAPQPTQQPANLAVPLAQAVAEPLGENAHEYADCAADIIEILDRLKEPLPQLRMVAEMQRHLKKEWSVRHVGRVLGYLMNEGSIVNPPKGRPRGYRLPEWESTSGDEATAE